jgi:putative ABC transport system permease protein
MRSINAENPVTDYANTARAVPIREAVTDAYRPAVLTLSFAVALLLLITCANVANLLLVKASVRSG